MKTDKIAYIVLYIALMAVLSVSPVFAVHDQGLGKSQDGKDHETTVDSRSVAPEPMSGLLFLAGTATVAWRLRGKRKKR